MKKFLHEYFDRVFCINMDRSTDRWSECCAEMQKHNLSIERFSGIDYKTYDPIPYEHRANITSAMCGCSMSHSAIMSIAAHRNWNVLILEDDFEILHQDFNERFAEAWAEVPSSWNIVYLGAHYGEPPKDRISKHLVRAGYIKTTSSYAISASHARFMAPLLATCQGPDDVISKFNPTVNAYVLHPRLIGQRNCMSTIWGTQTWNTQCMTDPHHEKIIEELPYERH